MDKFVCQEHNFPILFIDIQKSCSKILKCCVSISGEQRSLNLIPIESILQSSQGTFLQNWPPNNDTHFMNYVQSFYQKNMDLPSKIERIFQDLINNVVNILQTTMKNTVAKANQVQEMKSSTEKYFQKTISINILQECFSSQNELRSLEENLKEIVLSQFKNYEDNKERLIQEINIIEKEIEYLYLEAGKNSFTSIFNHFKQIDQFTDNSQLIIKQQQLLEEEQQSSNQRKQQKIEIDFQQNKQKIDKVIQLIDNQFNYCKKEFINEFKTKLSINCSWLEDISFENIQSSHFIQATFLDQRLYDLSNEIRLQKNSQEEMIKAIKNQNESIITYQDYLSSQLETKYQLFSYKQMPKFKIPLKSVLQINFRGKNLNQVYVGLFRLENDCEDQIFYFKHFVHQQANFFNQFRQQDGNYNIQFNLRQRNSIEIQLPKQEWSQIFSYPIDERLYYLKVGMMQYSLHDELKITTVRKD